MKLTSLFIKYHPLVSHERHYMTVKHKESKVEKLEFEFTQHQ